MQAIRVALCLVFLLEGCVIHRPDYPAGWPALDTAVVDHCSALAGIYKEFGESAEPYPYIVDGKPVQVAPRLSTYLFPYPPPHGIAVTNRLALSFFEPGVLQISAYENQRLVAKHLYSEKESAYECHGNYATILIHRGLDRSGALAYESTTMHLYKAADGSLALRTDSSGFGLYLIIPAGGSDAQWYRFESVREE